MENTTKIIHKQYNTQILENQELTNRTYNKSIM